MKLTKMDMSKVIVTALYNLDELVTEKNGVAWRHAVRLARQKKDHIVEHYNKAVRILNKKAKEVSDG